MNFSLLLIFLLFISCHYNNKIQTPSVGSSNANIVFDKLTDNAKKAMNSSCINCHGLGDDYPVLPNSYPIPRLEGLSKVYFKTAYKSYIHGVRATGIGAVAMANMASSAGLTDNDLDAIAQLYTSTKRPKSSYKDVLEIKGVEQCLSCHGRDGKGSDIYPNLAGQDISYLDIAMKAYKAGLRGDNHAMNQIFLMNFDEGKIFKLAKYFNSLDNYKYIPQKFVYKNKPFNKENVKAYCDICHGDDSQLSVPVARLDILSKEYISQTFESFALYTEKYKEKNKDLKDQIRGKFAMKGALLTVKDWGKDVKNYDKIIADVINSYASSIVPTENSVVLPTSAANCNSCHNGATAPELRGQRKDYIISSLRDYNLGLRKTNFNAMLPVMESMARTLFSSGDDDKIEKTLNEIADYFSSFTAKSE